MRHILIDTDTGSDDAAAIIMMLRAADIQVDAITTVAGNVDLHYATHNALVSVAMANTYLPAVYEGCDAPLLAPVQRATVHGVNGLSDIDYPRPDIPVSSLHAAGSIANFAKTAPDPEILALGPLTNIAMAIVLYPEAMKNIKRIVAMGGQYKFLNPHTPVAEFNISCDPHAAQVVLQSGIFTEFVPFDLCVGPCALNGQDMQKLRAFGSKSADFVLDCNRTLIHYSTRMLGEDALLLPDAIAAAYLIDPAVAVERIPCRIDCELASPLTIGQLIYDKHSVTPNGALIAACDPVLFKNMLFDLCK